MFSGSTWTFLACSLLRSLLLGVEYAASQPRPPFDQTLIETLRDKVHYAKEKLNAGNLHYIDLYYNNVSKIITIYDQLFLLDENFRPYIANETLKERRIETIEQMLDLIDLAAATTDDQPMPFGGRECGLLPPELRKYTAPNYTIAPRLSIPLNAFGKGLRDILDRVKTDGNTSDSANQVGLMPVCEAFNMDYILKPAISLIGRDCRNKSAEEESVERAMQQDLESFAKKNEFPDQAENGCLPVVVTEYVRSREAVRLLSQSLDKYLLATIMLQAFCVKFVFEYDRRAFHEKTVTAVDTLSRGMNFANKWKYSNPWSCDDFLSTTTEVSEASKGSVGHTKVTHVETAVNATAMAIGTDPSDINTDVTVTIPPMSAEMRAEWLKNAERLATKVISEASERIRANAWEKRSKELHPAITDALDKNLTAKFPQKITTFYSVAQLTYNDNGKNCTSYNEDSVYGTHEHVTYLAQPFSGSEESLNATKTALLAREQDILDKTFSSPSNNLCETAAMALKDVLGLLVKDTASAFVVVRCGYKFVWYQLGYEYFPAANSTSPYALTTRQNNVYSANCGQIILFP